MRILVVEDEQKIREYLVAAFKRESFHVDAVEKGMRAIDLVQVYDYDCVVLDNMLPDINGIDVCREIRELEIPLPILVLSVMSSPHDKTALLNAGADDYLAKPFMFKELLARVYALMRRPSVQIGDEITLHGISLNVQSKEVHLNDELIQLTKKEFMLLHYLMANAGIVLTRSMMFHKVWDLRTDPLSNTIEAHITSLRKKLKDDKHKTIQTIPGQGYKFTS